VAGPVRRREVAGLSGVSRASLEGASARAVAAAHVTAKAMPGGPRSGRHEAGLSTGSVYSDFTSKEEIVTAIADEVTQEITPFLEPLSAGAPGQPGMSARSPWVNAAASMPGPKASWCRNAGPRAVSTTAVCSAGVPGSMLPPAWPMRTSSVKWSARPR
jgi:hypothetical protein